MLGEQDRYSVLSGFFDGIVYPILGIDHLLAMASVGVVSVILGGRAIWAIPATFVTAMTIGSVSGLDGILLPHTEAWIAVFLVALGATITLDK